MKHLRVLALPFEHPRLAKRGHRTASPHIDALVPAVPGAAGVREDLLVDVQRGGPVVPLLVYAPDLLESGETVGMQRPASAERW